MTTLETGPCPPLDHSATLKGAYATLEGLRHDHMPSLWKHLDLPHHPEIFQWLPFPAPGSEEELWQMLQDAERHGLLLWAVKAHPQAEPGAPAASDHTECLGLIGYLDIQPENRAMELGGVIFGPLLQRRACATEAHYLLLKHALEPRADGQLQYRRIAYKCNAHNVKSRRAAERMGYTYEGRFRKHAIVKGENRDSDWLSMLDDEWPAVKAALEAWLAASNFDSKGRQIETMEAVRERLAK